MTVKSLYVNLLGRGVDMNKRQLTSIQKGIEKHMAKVAKTRDQLDEFISDMQALKEDCDKAYDALIDARDALSEMV